MRFPVLALLLVGSVPSLAAQSWAAQTSGTRAEFRGLHAVDARVVWAAGRGGIVVHTEDGGRQWTVDSIPGAGRLFLIAIHGLDARHAWAAGTAFEGSSLTRIYQTEDGGRSWSLEYENAARGAFLDGLGFWDARHGIAVGDPIDGTLLIVTTEDGGAHWSPLPAQVLPTLLPGEAAFAASGTAITVAGRAAVWIATGGGARARVLHSGDRGKSWDSRETPASGSASKGIFGIARGRRRLAVAVGGDYRQPDSSNENLLLSDDGGRSWRVAVSSGLLGVQYGVVYGGGSRFVSVSPAGSAFSKDGGRSWTRLPGPGFNTVSCLNRLCWAAGVDGRIATLVIR